MKSSKLTRFLASLMAVLMLSQATGVAPSVFAEAIGSEAQTQSYEQPELKDGEAVIPTGSDISAVKQILAKALIDNYDKCDPETRDSLEWEYECEGKYGLLTNTAWGSIEGFTSKKTFTYYTHPALVDNSDGSYQVRIKGTVTAVTLSKAAKLSSKINAQDVELAMPYNEDSTVNFDQLRADIFAKAVNSTTPELKLSDVTIEYYATNKAGITIGDKGHEWVALEGKSGTTDATAYPAIPEGTQKIRISWAGNDNYYGTSAEFSVTLKGRQAPSIELNENVEVALPYTDATSIDYAKLEELVLAEAVKSSTPELTLENTTITYFASLKTGSATDVDKRWMPLEGGTVKVGTIPFEYAAVSEGEYKVKLSFRGNDEYFKQEAELTVKFVGRSNVEADLNKEISANIKFNDDLSVDYDALRADIFAKAVNSTTPELKLSDVTIEYYAASNLDHDWMPLEGGKGAVLTYPAISAGTQEVRIRWAGSDSYNEWTSETITVNVVDARAQAKISFKENPTVKIAYNDDLSIMWDELYEAIWENVVSDGNVPESLSLSDVTIKYLATATTGLVQKWVDLKGETQTLIYPAIGEGTQKLQFSFASTSEYKGFTAEVEVQFTGRDNIPAVPGNISVNASFKNASDINYDALREAIWAAVSENMPADVTFENVKFQYKLGGVWYDFEGRDVVGSIAIPALKTGENQVKLSWAGNKNYNPWSQEITVNVVDARTQAKISFKENPTVKITYNDNIEIDFDALYEAIWENVVSDGNVPESLSLNDVTIKYLATATTGYVQEWADLKGEKQTLTYPAIGEGTQKLQFSFAGTSEYKGFTAEVEVQFTGREEAPFELNSDVTEIGLVYANVNDIDYVKTAQSIRETLVKATGDIGIENIKVEYNTLTDITPVFKPLDSRDNLLKLFGLGEFTIRLSWDGNRDYKAWEKTIDINFTDNRIQSEVVIRSDASITYNMSADAMMQAIFDNVIDWDNSTLPAKDTLTLDDFVITYYATANVAKDVDLGNENINDIISGLSKKWVPIEGKNDGITIAGKFIGVVYPQMGAGDQQIKIQYVGNAEYRPSAAAEGSLTVKKADVKIKVNSQSIYPNETPSADFITLDPNDPAIDVYVVYGGITSNLSGSIYLQLPSMDNGLIQAIDAALKLMGQPTLTDRLQEGITVRDLKDICNKIINFGGDGSITQEGLKLVLKQFGVDYDTFKNLMNALNKLPSLSDNVRVAFGTPNHAGLYLAVAVTDNENYNTAIGTGILTVKMRVSGMKIVMNDSFSKKMTSEEAQALKDSGAVATLQYNGEAVDNPNIHYLYSGIQSNFKPYSSTTEFPTAPGRYVVTVVTLGGDYLAAPVTKSFQITK